MNMIKLIDTLKDPMAVEYTEGMNFGEKVLKEYKESGVVELDFTGILAWNTAFFNGMIFKIISSMSYEEFLDKRVFKLVNAAETTKKTLSQSLELAELKFS